MTVPSPYAAQLDRIPVVRRTVDLLGSSTAWWEYGPADAAEVLVVVHGFRGDHHGLEPVVAQLPEVRILSPDLPGFGDSTPLVDARHDIPGYSTWLRAFVESTATRDATVLGHSFGSIVVSAALADGLPNPRAVLVNPIAAPALEGPRGVLTRLAVLYYRAAAVLPERAGFGLLRNRAIVRVMSEAMAKTATAGCGGGSTTSTTGSSAPSATGAWCSRLSARRCRRTPARTPRGWASRCCWSRPSATTSRPSPRSTASSASSRTRDWRSSRGSAT
ncbi:2-succinyl-6-hydroxy-2,4-cyclohexadiene-1-carboxylate synthase [Clavibacter michiganensis]|uniref:2-succinyl-6-hydroxy-2, 4-cyclohexadiene-1-carboxylate synthase n=1 Tax=Clavibacter michiganensis TaxID=28447 RepID=A0A251XVC8_9MICO|nr:2-succinyl-6-hydroxy-2,4-cyclohexadiene-1-carboxylate synthase [Clavibacter michiganensis]